jgi:hypothetical protein
MKQKLKSLSIKSKDQQFFCIHPMLDLPFLLIPTMLELMSKDNYPNI